jgi:hypothetical protein
MTAFTVHSMRTCIRLGKGNSMTDSQDVGDRDSLLARAHGFFGAMSQSDKLQAALVGMNHVAQFEPLSMEPFFVVVHNGKIEFGASFRFSKDLAAGLYIVEVQACLGAILSGDITLGEAIFHQKVRIPGYRNKEPLIAAFSKFLRLGVWAQVPAANILMPTR